MMDVKRNWRIILFAVVLSVAILSVASKGLVFGIDFIGGTELKMEIEKHGDEYIDAITEIFKNRLNSLGLKSMQVLPEVDRVHITLKVSTTDPGEISEIKNIINKQAVFEQYVEGVLCAKGDEIQLDIAEQGGTTVIGRDWRVYVKTTGDAPQRCGDTMKGKAGHMTDVFLDRPSEAVIILDEDTCGALSAETFINHASDAGYTNLDFIETRANIPVLCYRTGEENKSIAEELGLVFVNQTNNQTGEASNEDVAEELQGLYYKNRTDVILLVNQTLLPQEIQDKIGELNITVRVVSKGPDQPFHAQDDEESWIDAVTGLRSTLEIDEGLTYGKMITGSIFRGTSSTNEEAKANAERFKIWLTSGNLPVKVSVVMERPNLPELGQQFLKYSGIMALIAIGIVALIITIKYREPKISASIMMISISEIIIILGFASLVSWELDMASIAGIIAAVGTGVDDQIVITDETLRGERRERDKKVWDVKLAINRAFFIIFVAAATTILAMLPLMSIIDLKGFAFTTIVGVLIGIIITRPAYARIVEMII